VVYGIGKKMSISFSVFMVIVFSVIVWAILSYTQYLTRENIMKHQYAMTELIAHSIDHKLGGYMVSIELNANRVPAGAFEHPDQAQAFLDAHSDLLQLFDNGLLLMDTSYRIVAETPYMESRRGIRLPALTPFLKNLENNVLPDISNPYISPKTGNPAFAVAAQVHDKGGRLRGFLLGGINLSRDYFIEELMNYRIGKKGYLYLFNTERTMILHPDKSRIMKHDIPQGSNLLLDRAIKGFDGSGETVNSRGVPQIVSFKHLRTVDWILASAYPKVEAYGPISRLRNYLLLAAVLATFCSVLLIRLLVSRVTNNLESFTRQVANISVHPEDNHEIHIESGDEVSLLADSFNGLMRELDQTRKSLDDMTRIDFLTGLFNRRHLELEAPNLLALSKRNRWPLAVFMIDIDHFKRINDSLGHEAGDAVLVELAKALKLAVRPYDLVVRHGGEEFLVLMMLNTSQGADVIAERIRLSVSTMPISYHDESISITVSVGVFVTCQAEDVQSAVSSADAALYEAKNSGRNRACLVSDGDFANT
jgi:diguanylate cyclase (GGDEF)-like protein